MSRKEGRTGYILVMYNLDLVVEEALSKGKKKNLYVESTYKQFFFLFFSHPRHISIICNKRHFLPSTPFFWYSLSLSFFLVGGGRGKARGGREKGIVCFRP